jgi:Domain of unknown function (DUF4226)
VSIGLTDIVRNIVEDAVQTIGTVIVATGGLFAGAGAPQQPALDRTNRVLNGPPPAAPGSPPPPPPGQAGLNTGATDAGSRYDGAVNAAELTDEKLADLLKQIFASSQAARDKISAILTEIQTKQKLIAPELGDPASVTAFGQFLDQKFAEIQKTLGDAQVDAKTQAAILEALGDEYRTHGPNAADDPPNSGNPPPAGTGNDPAVDASTEPAPGQDPAAAGPTPLIDPLAGLGLGTPTGMDPISAMGPALAGLSALPGAMSGLGAGSPVDALGPALSSLNPLGGLANGFTDQPPAQDTKPDGLRDEPAKDGTPASTDPAAALRDDQEAAQPATATASPAPTDPAAAPAQHTPEQAAPQSAPAASSGDPARTVTMPDGHLVTAPDAQSAQVMRSVLSGAGVTDAFKQVGVDLAPPGTPVTDPVDPATMPPASVGRFESREPVLAMGNGKIWMDGQLQPISALGSTSDFLGWSKPPTQVGVQAATAAPAPPGSPPAAT